MTQNGGGKYIDRIDPDDPEYQKAMRRPAEIKEDMTAMESRRRVNAALSSNGFKSDLEGITSDTAQNLLQLKHIVVPQTKASFGGQKGASAPVVPINDLRGPEVAHYSKAEKIMRCKLASLYRLVDLHGWSESIYNHITYRLSQEHEHFLINPYGLLYHEITASSLVKIDMQGEIVDQGATTLGINKTGFVLHSAIHAARPDIKCIIHLHTPAATAVSVMKCGFLPLSQHAMCVGPVAYHDYGGMLFDPSERDTISRDLGPNKKVMFLRNHGVVVCGDTVEEAFQTTQEVMEACEMQVRVTALGLDNIILPSEAAQQQVLEQMKETALPSDAGGRVFKAGELEFSAFMRTLDAAGFRTGYLYPQSLISINQGAKGDHKYSDVEVPPTVSNFQHTYEEQLDLGAPYKYTRRYQRAEWLVNTPNAYQKVEFEETGTTNPKKITRWVSGGESPAKHAGQAAVPSVPNQYAPQGTNPREFRDHHKQVRKEYYDDHMHAGPESKILQGMSWDEAQDKIKEGKTQQGDSVIVVGAASKGIIKREYQHNAQVYNQQYSANPFANMSEAELEQYKKEIDDVNKTPKPQHGAAGDAQAHLQTDTVQVARQPESSRAAPAHVASVTPQASDVSDRSRPVIKPRPPGYESKSLRKMKHSSDLNESGDHRTMNGDDTGKDTLRSTDDETGDDESPSKGKKEKKKFRMPSFSSKIKQKSKNK